MLRMNNRIALGSNLGKSIGNGTNNRYFTTLDGTADYYTIPTVTLSNTFTFECEFALTSLTGDHAIISNSALNEYVRIDATNGGVDMQLKSQFRSNSGKFTADGKKHRLKLISTEIGGNQQVEIYYDEVLIDTYLFNILGNTVWDGIGVRRNGLTNYFSGIISDVKITDGTDLIRYYKIDEDLSGTSTIIDSGSDGSNGTAVSITSSELFTLEGADWIGAELLIDGDMSSGTGWTTKQLNWVVGSGVATYTPSDGNNAILAQITTAIAGAVYISKYTAVNNSGSCQIFHGGGASVTATSVSGTYTNIKARGSDSVLYFFSLAGFDGTVDNISYKRILQAP